MLSRRPRKGAVRFDEEREAVVEGGASWGPKLDGGFTVLERPSRAEAITRAARIAKACRCDQERRVFHFDPQS